MFLLSLKNDKVVRTDWDDRGLLFAMAAMDIYDGAAPVQPGMPEGVTKLSKLRSASA